MSKRLKIIIPIVLIIVVAIVCLFVFNDKKDKFEGLWDIDGNTKYQFDGKGNGKLIIPLGEYAFSYTITDNIISIDFENEESEDSQYEYVLSNNKLEITNVKVKDMKFVLKKMEK